MPPSCSTAVSMIFWQVSSLRISPGQLYSLHISAKARRHYNNCRVMVELSYNVHFQTIQGSDARYAADFQCQGA
jgi:hypothetical protein